MPTELKTVTDSSAVNLERHVLSMLYDSVPGGVLVSYYRPDFPLYYIDDRMLRYLNYESQEEFAAATDNGRHWQPVSCCRWQRVLCCW